MQLSYNSDWMGKKLKMKNTFTMSFMCVVTFISTPGFFFPPVGLNYSLVSFHCNPKDPLYRIYCKEVLLVTDSPFLFTLKCLNFVFVFEGKFC